MSDIADIRLLSEGFNLLKIYLNQNEISEIALILAKATERIIKEEEVNE